MMLDERILKLFDEFSTMVSIYCKKKDVNPQTIFKIMFTYLAATAATNNMPDEVIEEMVTDLRNLCKTWRDEYEVKEKEPTKSQ